MNFKAFMEHCSVEDEEYGGIPDGGGYRSYTEYEIGAQQIAEAAHCILGSLGKFKFHDKSYEKGHIFEELAIIKKSIAEYSNPIYIKQLSNDKYSKASIESIVNNSSKLAALAEKKKNQINTSNHQIKAIAIPCYDLVIALANEMSKSVMYWPRVENAFSSIELQGAVKALENIITAIYR